ncbi:unnamed protein product, partial [marine sediment metagenome]
VLASKLACGLASIDALTGGAHLPFGTVLIGDTKCRQYIRDADAIDARLTFAARDRRAWVFH